MRAGDLALANADAVRFFADLQADVAFLGSGGVSARAGLTDYHVDEVATRRVISGNAQASYALADASKLDRVAAHRVCGLSELTGVLTDGPVPAALRAALEQSGTAIHLPD